MFRDQNPSPAEIQRSALLTDCVEGSWNLLARQLGKVKGSDGKRLQKEINNRVPLLSRSPLTSWGSKLEFIANDYLRDDQRFKSLTEARVALLTQNGFCYRVLKASGQDLESLPQGYIKTMNALNATLPWNRTGYNSVTIGELTPDDVSVAASFVQEQLGRF